MQTFTNGQQVTHRWTNGKGYVRFGYFDTDGVLHYRVRYNDGINYDTPAYLLRAGW